MDKNLGGAFIWSVEMDDFRGTCEEADYPLLSTINKVLRYKQNDVSTNTAGKRYRPTDEAKEPPRGNKATQRKGTKSWFLGKIENCLSTIKELIKTFQFPQYLVIQSWPDFFAGAVHKAVHSGVAFAHFGIPDTTTQITVTSKEHLKRKFPPDSDISSENAIYRFPEMEMSSQNRSDATSKSLGLNHFTENNSDKSRTRVSSKNKIGRENVHFGNNLNLNVKSVRKKAKPRKVPKKSTQTQISKDILIHPQEVVTKRENVNTLSHQEPSHKNYANNVNGYSNQSFVQSNGYLRQYSGVPNEVNSNPEGRSERPNIFLPANERSQDALDVNQNIQRDNVDADYDLANPQVSYSYETATKRSPVQSSRVQKGGTYDNQGVDDRETEGINKPVKEQHQVSQSKCIENFSFLFRLNFLIN